MISKRQHAFSLPFNRSAFSITYEHVLSWIQRHHTGLARHSSRPFSDPVHLHDVEGLLRHDLEDERRQRVVCDDRRLQLVSVLHHLSITGKGAGLNDKVV